MSLLKRQIKRIVFDIAGFGLIILGLSIGWLPGPGGIPLVLAGLGILSIHNYWAKSILDYSKKNGLKFVEIIYSGKPLNTRLHWFLEVALLVIAALLLYKFYNSWVVMICGSLLVMAFVDFWLTYTNKKS
jgi:hypothetical protein